MDNLYPPGPEAVSDDLTKAGPVYKRRAGIALLSLILFLVLYVSLTAWFGWTAYTLFAEAAEGGKGSFAGFLLALAAAFLAVFLAKALFFVDRGGEPNDLEITAAEQPKLFEFLYRLADEAGAPRPHRVFLSNRVNAAVFYNLTLLNLLFPSKKNLEIGLPLVNALPLGELKAVLAHEFGHFKQGSMAVGRWVYVAQQIATHIIQERDILDRFLQGLSRFDIRIAWIGWILSLIVWALRALLDTAFSLVVLAQRYLSREMEFHADLVSVSLAGSDALIHALHRLHAADDAWERALGIAAAELGQGKAVTDVYVLQKVIVNRVKEILDDEHYDAPPPLPETDRENHRVFETEQVHPPRMWSTHPPNHAREENAKREYVAAPQDDRTAWVLFENAKELREQMTARLFEGSDAAKEAEKVDAAEAMKTVAREYGKTVYNRRYRGAYLGRSVAREYRTPQEMYRQVGAGEDLRAAFAGLYPESFTSSLEEWQNVEQERGILKALQLGTLTTPDGVIRHRSRILKRRELRGVIRELGKECVSARQRVCDYDKDARSVSLAAAGKLGQGWDAHLQGLAGLLHYADHTEADLLDVRAYFANVWSVVIADGKVTKSEVRRLLDSGRVVHQVMEAVETQKSQVSLSADVAKKLEVNSWKAVLNEAFNLPPPSKENINDWMGVIDSWLNYFIGAMGALQRETVEALLEAEAHVEKCYLENKDPGQAPVPPAYPPNYKTLLPGEEREQQTKLGLWDRFQIADGFFPSAARFLVAATIVGGVLGFGFLAGSAAVTVYNGLDTTVHVSIGSSNTTVHPFSTSKIDVPSESSLTVTTTTLAGEVIDTLNVDAHNRLTDYVYNIAGAGPLVEWTAAYGTASERPERYLGAPRWITTDADVLFREPPNSVSVSRSSGGATRDVLTGFGEAEPAALRQLLPQGADPTPVILAHVMWDDTGSANYRQWLDAATVSPRFETVLAQRMERDPQDLVLRLAELDYAGGDKRASLCASYVAQAAQQPGNADIRDLASYCEIK